MNNIFSMPETVTLIQAVEQMKPAANYLTQTFFSQKLPTVNTEMIACEYRKGKRLTAPYIVRGGRGVDVARTASYAQFFHAPTVATRRVLTVDDMNRRIFGEQPVFSTKSPQERAAQILAMDLQEQIAMHENTRNAMAAKILQGEPVLISGYADDGEKVVDATIDYKFTQTKPVTWSQTSAKITDDLREGIETIAEGTGQLPTILLCGRNIEKYLLANTELKDWAKSLRENWAMMAIQPKYQSPQTRYIGTLSLLGLEVYSYFETYTDTDGTVKPFIDPDTAILLSPNMGKIATGAVSLITPEGPQTFASEYVPFYNVDTLNQNISLTVYSRFILIPDDIESYFVFKVQ